MAQSVPYWGDALKQLDGFNTHWVKRGPISFCGRFPKSHPGELAGQAPQ
jgi:hypothetical protein